jgi:hypothetical protein
MAQKKTLEEELEESRRFWKEVGDAFEAAAELIDEQNKAAWLAANGPGGQAHEIIT